MPVDYTKWSDEDLKMELKELYEENDFDDYEYSFMQNAIFKPKRPTWNGNQRRFAIQTIRKYSEE